MSDLQVTNGQPDDDELAAVVIALKAMAAATPSHPASRWRTSLGRPSIRKLRAQPWAKR